MVPKPVNGYGLKIGLQSLPKASCGFATPQSDGSIVLSGTPQLTGLSFEDLVLEVSGLARLTVANGNIDDAYNGLLGWFWIACVVATIILIGVTRAALREREYSAVMAATGLMYLAILTGFGQDLVARVLLNP